MSKRDRRRVREHLNMRIAIVSDMHGNFTALKAVLADLRETSPDMVFHGGDLADGERVRRK